MSATVRPLIEVLREVAEVRKRRGRRHPLEAVLALACAAMVCGYRSDSAIAEWGRTDDAAFIRALGFTHAPTPCAATLFHVFGRLDRMDLEARLGAWAEPVLQATASGGTDLEAVAMDGKTLRGSRKQGAPAAHLLSAVSHRLGLPLGQMGVDDKTNEIPVTPLLLAGLVLAGRVCTMDALLTQRAIAQTMGDGGGDSVMVVKDNQPHLEADIRLNFSTPPARRTPLGTRLQRRRLATGASSSGG